MFSYRKPTDSQLKEFLWQHRDMPFTYKEVEGTRSDPPNGYSCGRLRVCLGSGRQKYLQARRSLESWKMFPLEFVEVIWPAPLEPSHVVATLFRAPGFWTLNPCRIVYVFDETVNRNGTFLEQFGFAYGTIGSHLACGEERFSVEYDHGDESVWYEVYCFSKAEHWLAKTAYPYLRIQQHRFRRLSALAMHKAVNDATDSKQAIVP